MRLSIYNPLRGIFAALAICFAVGGCGGGSGGGPPANSMGGLMNVADFNLPVGQTRDVTSDLTINATGNIEIAGKLIVEPGVNVGLYANGTLHMAGSVVPGPARAATRGGRDENPPHNSFIYYSSDIKIDKDFLGLNQTLDANSSFYIACKDVAGTVTINVPLMAGAGQGVKAGTARDGIDGGGIFIGNGIALDAIRADAKNPQFPVFAPSTVTIRTTLRAGDGANGGDDFTGSNQGKAGAVVNYSAGNGGAGGDIRITTNDLAGEIDLAGAKLIAGNGGRGGSAGHAPDLPDPHDARLDGNGQNGAGQTESILTGSGGSGGSTVLFAKTIPVNIGTAGYGNAPGDAIASPGNGAASSKGGNAIILSGVPGIDGVGKDTNPYTGSGYKITLRNGGNGGDSTTQSKSGGPGGDASVAFPGNVSLTTRRDPKRTQTTWTILVASSGSGGKGFNGCSLPTAGFGTNGGPAGTLTVQNAAYTYSSGYIGGRAGDGAPPGVAGKAGKDDAGTKLGADGGAGQPCGCGQGTYTAKLIGPGEALAVNHTGHVVGTNGGRAWFWDGMIQQDIGAGIATAVNDSDVVVGYLGSSVGGAWIWDKTNGRRPLPDLIGGAKSFAYGINNAGVVVGQAAVQVPGTAAGFNYEAAQWINGVPQKLPSLAADETATALAINAGGVVVGWDKSAKAGNSIVAVRWRNGTIEALQPLAGGFGGTAFAIGPSGDTVGLADPAQPSNSHAVVWKAGSTAATDLGPGASAPPSQALGVNGAIVVGCTGDVQRGRTATLFNGTAVVPLQSVICSLPGHTFYEATGVNDLGKIAANGFVNQVSQAYLLTPN